MEVLHAHPLLVVCLLSVPFNTGDSNGTIIGKSGKKPYSFERFQERVIELKHSGPQFPCTRIEMMNDQRFSVKKLVFSFTTDELIITDLSERVRYHDMGWTGAVSRLEMVDGETVQATVDRGSDELLIFLAQKKFRERSNDVLMCLQLLPSPGSI